jgi:uncharacterized protein
MHRLIDEKLLTDTLNVNWHAGEPLVLPPAFYDHSFRCFEEHNSIGVNIKHFFQTNGTLITPEFCELISKYDVKIGISIDGPQFINDRQRFYRDGRGSFQKIMQGVQLLREHEIDFSVISVLTDYSLDFPDQLYDFYKDLRPTSIGFNIEEIEGCHQETSVGEELIHKLYAFLSRFYRHVLADEMPIVQREYTRALKSILYGTEEFKNGLVTPLSTISIAANGDFTVFSPELLTFQDQKYGSYVFGNVKENSFHSIYENDKFMEIFSEIRMGVDKCRANCEYFTICGGGSPSNKLHENGSFNSTETKYCLFNTKIPADLVLADLGQ